jgi:membrane-associated protease RseP (regulator of RpoE activity)
LEEEEHKRFEFQYGIVMFRTKRFQGLLESLGKRKISKPVGWAFLYLMPIAAAVGFYLFLTILWAIASPVTGPTVISNLRQVSILGNLGLPGINPYIPVVDGWIALVVAMIVHEGAHGVVARSLGFPVKSSGLVFLLFIPIGAFVEVDDKALKVARARDSARILAAGAGINLVVGVLCLGMLVGVVSTMHPAASGIGVVGVYPSTSNQTSPADLRGVKPGDFITAVNGVPINDPATIRNSSWYQPGNSINITLWRQGSVVQLNDVQLASLKYENATSGVVYVRAFLGVYDISERSLRGNVTAYTNSLISRPALYICIPTLGGCQYHVPFSDTLSIFYASSLGGAASPLANLLYWIFFLNFNLAIFNALPIYPLDGGQAFRVGVEAAGRGKLSEKTVTWIVAAVSLAVVAMVLVPIVIPHLF